ncbi:hypothetical protein ACTMTI_24550 [Nonomuraea sp. H19]|uniref:hypothetical protein n=1 Tax=Nonomuraea sp. H19 TaxID=3452206 RepID=UPI003F8A1619
MVELGSPRWSQGSRLRVGVMWLWDATPHARFDVLHPGHESTDFLNEAQFSQSIRSHCELAVERVEGYRRKFRDVAAAAEFLASSMPNRPTPWDQYHAGVAAALIGDAVGARAHFSDVLDESADGLQWLGDLQDKIRALTELMDDREAFCAWASAVVADTRRQLKLCPARPDVAGRSAR